jgi:hypothetical protein
MMAVTRSMRLANESFVDALRAAIGKRPLHAETPPPEPTKELRAGLRAADAVDEERRRWRARARSRAAARRRASDEVLVSSLRSAER